MTELHYEDKNTQDVLELIKRVIKTLEEEGRGSIPEAMQLKAVIAKAALSQQSSERSE